MSAMEHLKSTLKVDCAQLSQAGIKPVNEDSIGIRIPDGSLLTHKGIVAVIADGVSAAEAGREASQACVQNLLYDYYCTPETWTVQKSVLAVLDSLNRWLFSQGSHIPDSSKGYITTLSIIIFKSSTAHLFHIGDSRIYRRRDNQIEQLTTDHARKVGNVTYLARAMGLDSKIQVDYRKEPLLKNDQFILTTDGIHDFYGADQWSNLFSGGASLDDIVKALADKALNAGSNDNISCQIITIEDVAAFSREEVYQSLASLPFPPFLSEGEVIDGLQIERTLYESKRSQLYLVHDRETLIKYVMKTPSVNFEDDPAYIERFVMQTWLGKKFRSNKLIHVVTPRVQPTFLYCLMEYADGITLEEWMHRNTSPPLDKVVRIGRQIGIGLRALHRQQIVHKDLKPDNIMIDDNEQIKLIDYGSCSISSMDELPIPFQREVALGTANYSAPECHLGKLAKANADVFSLAVILYEMLTGRLPYQGKMGVVTKEADLVKLQYQSVTTWNKYVPVWFDLALKKALSVNPEHRYDDVDEFLYDLEHPNTQLLQKERAPLVIQNPVRFWQVVALIQLSVILYLLKSHI